jgi:acetyl-CoA carboxylase carboxyltransferase component
MSERVFGARARTLDDARPEAVAGVHARRHLTARQRIALTVDDGSFVEYGILAGDEDEPAAGIVGGLATLFGKPIVVASYDYSVRGASQTLLNHTKIDRLMDIAQRNALPWLLFADGGGARAQNAVSGGESVYGKAMGGIRYGTIDGVARLSGHTPTVAIVAGRAFSGNASVAAFCDAVFSTSGSAMGIGGPPLVEAALGLKLTPEEIAPAEMLERIGGIEALLDDDTAAIEAARRYLSFYLIDTTDGRPSHEHDQISELVPEDPGQVYDMRSVLEALFDAESIMELKPAWAQSVITAFARLGGRSVGVIANQPASEIAGALDGPACDKLARFIRVCDSYGFPLVSLIDMPGWWTGPAAEEQGIIRRQARPVLAQAHRSVPLYAVAVRRNSARGGMAMSWRPDLVVAWPTAIPAWVSDGSAAPDPLINGRAFAVDDVLDPAETRDRLIKVMALTSPPAPDPKRHYIDSW